MKVIPYTITKKAYEFCIDYVKNNQYDKTYENSGLYEYYFSSNIFKTNFEYKYVCLGHMPEGYVIDHVDEGRESSLIVPLKPLVIRQKNLINVSDAFIIDTTKMHGAESNKGSLFIAFDFNVDYKTLVEKFTDTEKILIDV